MADYFTDGVTTRTATSDDLYRQWKNPEPLQTALGLPSPETDFRDARGKLKPEVKRAPSAKRRAERQAKARASDVDEEPS